MSSTSKTLHLTFRDRADAGAALGKALLNHRDWQDPVVLGLTHGGVPVAAEVARELDAPLDVLVVRRIGHPQHAEFAIGAFADKAVVLHGETDSFLASVSPDERDRIAQRERPEFERQQALLRGEHQPVPLQGREVILVDEGLDTGATMRAAIEAVRQLDPARVTVAVPIGRLESCDALGSVADDVFCVRSPDPFERIERWYSEFPPVSDEDVRSLVSSTVAG